MSLFLCFLSFRKIPILFHKPLHWVEPKHKHFNETLLSSIVRAIRVTKTTTAWQITHSFGPFQFYTRKIMCPRYFIFSGRSYPKKGNRTHDLRFWRMWNWLEYANEFSKRCAINTIMRLKSIQKRSDFDSILFTGSAAQTANIQRWSRHPVRNTHVTTTGMCVTHTSTPLQPQRLSEMVSPLQPQACV